MSAILRAYSPNALLDWDRVFAGDMDDDLSGLTWELSGNISQSNLLGETLAVIDGGAVTRLCAVPFAPEWTAIIFCKKIRALPWGRIVDTANPQSGGDSNIAGISINNYEVNDVFAFFNPPGAALRTDLVMPCPTGTMACYGMAYRSGQIEIWQNGRLLYSYVVNPLIGNDRDWYIGCGYRGERWAGEIGGWAFWRRALAPAELKTISDAMMPVTVASASTTANSFCPSVVLADCVAVAPRAVRADGLSGPGSIVGTVKINQRPAGRLVRCWDHETATLVAETWSDITTGAYRFDGLALDRLYFLASHDHEREYNAAVADYRYAEVIA